MNVLPVIDVAGVYVDGFVRRMMRNYQKAIAKAEAAGEEFEPHREAVIAFERGTYVAEQVKLARAAVADLIDDRQRMADALAELSAAAKDVRDNAQADSPEAWARLDAALAMAGVA